MVLSLDLDNVFAKTKALRNLTSPIILDHHTWQWCPEMKGTLYAELTVVQTDNCCIPHVYAKNSMQYATFQVLAHKGQFTTIKQTRNVAIVNALQLEAARRRAVPIRFNLVARAKFEVAQPRDVVSVLNVSVSRWSRKTSRSRM